MATCQNQLASKHVFPRGPTPVEDRRMTLELQCRENGTHLSHFTGLGTNKSRAGATVREFYLCENHSQLFTMVNTELMEEGWGTIFAKPYDRLG
jgi:hypothetical protein